MYGPEEQEEETGFEIGENVGRSDSPDDVYDDRLVDARPTGITVPPEDEDDDQE